MRGRKGSLRKTARPSLKGILPRRRLARAHRYYEKCLEIDAEGAARSIFKPSVTDR